VDEATEKVAPAYASHSPKRVASRRGGEVRVWRLEVERAVWPAAVVMAHVDVENLLELAATDDQEPVEAFAAGAADPALDVRVRIWRPDGVRMTLTPSLAKMASNAAENLLSRS
jgi:hypothetical protein